MIDVPVEVKDALKEGSYKKNYRIVVLDDEGAEDFTIDNNNLVSESVSVDERMVSGDTLKFGLCEGSSLEFQYFDRPNIVNKRLQVFIDVDYGENEPYTIPMGFFTVEKCSRQASTGIRKVTAYNKLQSDYLDAKANELIDKSFTSDAVTFYEIKNLLLSDYEIESYMYVRYYADTETYIPSAPINTNVRVTDVNDDSTPISGYNFVFSGPPTLTTTTPIEFSIRSYKISLDFTTADEQWAFLEASKYSLKQMSYDFVDYFKTLINESHLSVTGEQIIDGIQNATDGWRYIFSVVTTEGTTKKYYADYPVMENKQGTRYPLDGTIEEFCKLLHEKPITIDVYIPRQLHWKYTQTISGITYAREGDMSFLSDARYKKTDHTYAFYPSWKYPDGKRILTDYTPQGLTWWIYLAIPTNIAPQDLLTVNPHNLPDVTLRELIGASYEIDGLFGQLSRITDLFGGVELNHSRLFPQEALYPDNALYPDGAQMSASKAMYSKLWADEGNVHKWKYLIITYKGLDGEGNEKDYTLQRTVNTDGTDNYNCSDNWLFRNLIWTAEQIGEYADAMVAKMQDVTWFPFEMWCAGLPYLETGDEIEIPLGEESYTSYVLQRQLKGIQNLQDTYINGTLDIF